MTCGICATARWQLSNWVASSDELQPEHRTQSIQLPITAHINRGEDGGGGILPVFPFPRLPLLTGRNVFWRRPRRTPRVNNPINAKYNTPLDRSTTTSYKRVCLPLRLCFGDLQDYFFMGTTLHPQQLLHTGSTVAMAIFEPGKEEKRERKKESGREKEKRIGGKKNCLCWESGAVVLRVDKEIAGLVLLSQLLILPITDDRGDERPCKGSQRLHLSGNKLAPGGQGCAGHTLLIKWAQTYIPLTSCSRLLRNLKVQRQIP